MLFLAFSDSHGHTDAMDEVIAAYPEAVGLIHCGDVERDTEYLAAAYPRLPLYTVRGNNDFWGSEPYHRTLTLLGHKIYLTHGHIENVKNGMGGLLEKCKKLGCKAAVFGHTHQPVNVLTDGVLLLNPGSIRSSLTGTFSVITINEAEICAVNRSMKKIRP